MTDRRMDAYYYEFEPTGVDAVDKILSAVACAGKASHHTAGWNDDDTYTRDDHTGNTPVERIQNAANEAAQAWGTRTDPWQPIETAPKDGTEILGYAGGFLLLSWRDDEWHEETFEESGWNPTHWMPMPAPPKETEND